VAELASVGQPVSWRETEAEQLCRLVGELDAVLARVYEAEAILELRGRAGGAAEARSFAALLRTEINTLNTEARQLRRVEQPTPLPMSITSRRAR
jgi:hypothetical protein